MAKMSKYGKFTKEDLISWIYNILVYTMPLFLGTLFTQLSLGVELREALITSTFTLYGAIANYFDKKYKTTKY